MSVAASAARTVSVSNDPARCRASAQTMTAAVDSAAWYGGT